MTTTVLIPNSTPERCYLREALLWVAVNRFPLAYVLENTDDIRVHDKYVEEGNPSIDEDLLSADECASMGLPVNPEWEAAVAFEHHLDPKTLEFSIANARDEATRKHLQRQLAESVALSKRVVEWKAKFEALLDLHAAKLFVALRQGDIAATGKKLPARSWSQLRKHFEKGENLYGGDWETIPKEFWVSQKIDWENSRAAGERSSYALILVETAALFRTFPFPEPPVTSQVARIGNGYVLIDTGGVGLDAPVSARGRPSFPWEQLFVEIARRAKDGNLPTKQEAFIAEISDWCRLNWGNAPGRSTLLQKIKPFYDALFRKSEN